MKRIGKLKEKFLTMSYLEEAVNYLCTPAKQHKWTKSASRSWKEFLDNKEENLKTIYDQLYNMSYVPGPFKIFKRFENKKERKIYASYPKDLIVDYILTKCLEYVFMEKKKIVHRNCYGSIKGKGQHELRQKIIDLVHNRDDLYVAICDTRHYYPTINHNLLMRFIKRHIKDKWALWLTKITIDRTKGYSGIALGLSSSNILGHVYHASIDWEMIIGQGMSNYYRFCDDKIMISPDKNYLHTLVRILRDLIENNEQELKPNWKIVYCKEHRFEFLGAMINSHNARMKTYNRRRTERRFKKEISLPFDYKKNTDRIIRSWAGLSGSFKGLEVRNLIRWWTREDSPYLEYFRRLWQAKTYIKQKRKGTVPYIWESYDKKPRFY